MEVFQESILQIAKADDGHVGDATKKMVDWILDAHKKGELALQDIPTYKQVKQFFGSKKGVHSGVEGIPESFFANGEEIVTKLKFSMGEWEGHHVIPKYIQTRLKQLLGKAWDLDEVPVAMVTRAEHWFPDGVHAFISGNGLHWGTQMNQFSGTAGAVEILNRLEQAYVNAGRLDLQKVVQAWRQTIL